jgi:DNA-binding transcriptional LysR family regulator
MLGLTQSAVSHAIGQIEDNLGVQLLDRQLRPIVPTAAGKLLLRYAEQLLNETDRVVAIMCASERGVVPMIRLGMVDSFATTVGAQLIRHLEKVASEVSVLSGQSPTLRTSLLNRQLDLVICSDQFTDVVGLERHVLLQEPFIVIVPKETAAKCRDVSLRELAKRLPFIRPSPQSATGCVIATHLGRLRIEVTSAVEFNNADAIIAMVAENIGWAITTPLCLLHNNRVMSDLAVLPLSGPGLGRQLALIGRQGEFGEIPLRIAELARHLLRRKCYSGLCRIAPFSANQIRIGDHPVPSAKATTSHSSKSAHRFARPSSSQRMRTHFRRDQAQS